MTYFISEISPQKKRKDRVNIFTDDGFLLSLSLETLAKNKICTGIELSEETVSSLKQEDTLQFAKELAFSYLSYQSRTKKRLNTYLLSHGIDEDSAEKAILLMEEYGYLNDEEYAKSFARSYLKKYSAKTVHYKLIQEGISQEIADSVLASMQEEEASSLSAIYKKLEHQYASLAPDVKKRRLSSALMRRGFSWEQISPLFQEEEL